MSRAKNHHQLNKPLNPLQTFATRMNYLTFQLKGTRGNLMAASQAFNHTAKQAAGSVNPDKIAAVTYALNNALKAMQIAADVLTEYRTEEHPSRTSKSTDRG